MMKFCAEISYLDIECSILDIQYLFCQTTEASSVGRKRHHARPAKQEGWGKPPPSM